MHIAMTESGLCWCFQARLLALPDQAVIRSFRAGVSPVCVPWVSRQSLFCDCLYGLELL